MKTIFFTLIPIHLSYAIPLSTWEAILQAKGLYCDLDLEKALLQKLPKFKHYQSFDSHSISQLIIDIQSEKNDELTIIFGLNGIDFLKKLDQIASLRQAFIELHYSLIYLAPPAHLLLNCYQSLGLLEQNHQLHFYPTCTSISVPASNSVSNATIGNSSSPSIELFYIEDQIQLKQWLQSRADNINRITAIIEDALGATVRLLIKGEALTNDMLKDLFAYPWTYPLYLLSGNIDQSLGSKLGLSTIFPLKNQEVVITRADGQLSALAQPLKNLGAQVIACPSIEIQPIEDFKDIDSEILALKSYDWVIFTSTNGVDCFFRRVYALGLDMRIFGNAKLACIGSATSQALKDWGLRSDLIPQQYVAESLIEAFESLSIKERGQSILIPRAQEARELLPIKLQEMGMNVKVLPVYQTVKAILPLEVKNKLLLKPARPRLICFTANSTVENFTQLFEPSELSLIQAYSKAISIGPISGQKAKALGYDLVAQAEEFTIPGLIKALVDYIQHGKVKSDFS